MGQVTFSTDIDMTFSKTPALEKGQNLALDIYIYIYIYI